MLNHHPGDTFTLTSSKITSKTQINAPNTTLIITPKVSNRSNSKVIAMQIQTTKRNERNIKIKTNFMEVTQSAQRRK